MGRTRLQPIQGAIWEEGCSLGALISLHFSQPHSRTGRETRTEGPGRAVCGSHSLHYQGRGGGPTQALHWPGAHFWVSSQGRWEGTRAAGQR